MRLNVAAAPSLSLWTGTIVASTSKHDHLGGQGGPSHARGGDPAREQVPHPVPGLCPRRGDPLQRGRGQLVQRPPRRGWGRDRAQHPHLVAQRVDVSDGLTSGGDHRGQVDQDLATVMTRGELPSRRGRGQVPGQADPIRQRPHRHAPCVSHHAGPVPGHEQTTRPRCTLHLPGAFPSWILRPSQVKYLVAGQALWCIPGACHDLNREGPRLMPLMGNSP